MSTKPKQESTYSLTDLMKRGEAEYDQLCAMCHKASGKGMPPTFPALVGSPIVVNKENMTEHIRQIVYGKNAMPAFGQFKSDLDIAAMVTYERNAWGNNTGDVCQPSDVKTVRETYASES